MSANFEHNIGDHEDPLPGPTWIVGLLGAVLLAVIVMGLTAIYHTAAEDEREVKVVNVASQELESLRAAQNALISGSPKWVETQVVEGEGDEQATRSIKALAIPVDQAMKLIVQEAAAAKAVPPSS